MSHWKVTANFAMSENGKEVLHQERIYHVETESDANDVLDGLSRLQTPTLRIDAYATPFHFINFGQALSSAGYTVESMKRCM